LHGRLETEEEYEKRINYELKKSKDIIENKLNKKVKFLCWAGGAITNKALLISSEIGYISSTAGKDMKNKRKHLKNKYGDDPSRINRIGISLYWDGTEGFGSKIRYMDGFYLVASLQRFQGKKTSALLSSLILIARARLYKLKYDIL